MTRHWTIFCLLLTLGLVSTQISAVAGPSAMADNGNGNGDEKKDKDKEKKDKKDKDKENGNAVVEPALPYQVEATCDHDEAASQTTCTFAGVAPEGAKKIGHLDLPAAEVCAAVLGGDADYVDPDPNTGVVGYKSKGSEGMFSLILEGNVTTGGSATYWFKTGDGVFPATGPGLVCSAGTEPASAAPTEISVTGALVTPATTDDAAIRGMIAVHTYACAVEPTSTDVDWFGTCEPGVPGMRFTLARVGPAAPDPPADGTSDDSGALRFERLTPGAYSLDAPDAVWCHAESDNVNQQGELVISPGAEVSVWIFLCGLESVS